MPTEHPRNSVASPPPPRSVEIVFDGTVYTSRIPRGPTSCLQELTIISLTVAVFLQLCFLSSMGRELHQTPSLFVCRCRHCQYSTCTHTSTAENTSKYMCMYTLDTSKSAKSNHSKTRYLHVGSSSVNHVTYLASCVTQVASATTKVCVLYS